MTEEIIPNIEIAKKAKGKTIVDVLDDSSPNWWDPEGFTLVFDDGTKLAISADCGQATGFVIAEWET